MPDRLDVHDLKDTMAKAAGALRGAGVSFVLGGGLAAAARGGPATAHDVDFLIRREDVDAALDALRRDGFRVERPPEGWLVKAWDGDVLVDLIFSTADGDIGADDFERADELEVYAVSMLVQSPEDPMVAKLMAIDELTLKYKAPLEIARALREQIDWEEVRRRTEGSPYAKAFFTLIDELGVSSEEELAPR